MHDVRDRLEALANEGSPRGASTVMDVQWGQAGGSSGAVRDPLEEYRAGGTPINIRGHDGLVSTEDGWIVWEETPGTIVLVSGKQIPEWGANSPALPETQLNHVAA